MVSKKGVSAVVATVFLIMLAIFLVVIIWTAIVPMIDNKMTSTAACKNAQEEVYIIDDEWTCFPDRNDWIYLHVKRGLKDIPLNDLMIIAYDGGDSYSGKLIRDANEVYKIPEPGRENVWIGKIANTLNLDSVGLAAVVKVGSKNYTCEIGSISALNPCSF